MYEVLSIGEALIDFIPLDGEVSSSLEKPPVTAEIENNAKEAVEEIVNSGQLKQIPLFKESVGGSPANVACALAKLGVKTGFVGKVGNDSLGHTVEKVLSECGVDTKNLIMAADLRTPAALVHHEEGKKSFTFYRGAQTADTHFEEEEIDDAIFEDCKVFNFSSFPLSHEPSRSTVLNAVVKAKESGAKITFDPNLRLSIWESPEQAREVVLNALTLADILKISEDDFKFLFPGIEEREACEQIYLENGTEMIIITRSDRGCYAYVNQSSYLSSAYDVPVVDTTGSGDAFLSGIIFNIMKLNKSIHDMSSVEITIMLDFANAVGSLVTTRPGAIAAFPTPREITHCMQRIPKKIPVTNKMDWES